MTSESLETASRRRRYVLRGLAAGIGLLAAAIPLELALRVLGLAPADAVATVTESDFARLPGIFAPNERLIDRRMPELPHLVTINSLGYRGLDFPREKPAGEVRVLMVGDSFTYGDFVDDDATFPAQLERELRARAGPVRVINAGLGGSTIVAHQAMVDRARSLDPDLVVLTFSENDVDDLANPLWRQLAINRHIKSRLPMSIVYPTMRRLALWNFALDVRAHLVAGRRQRTAAAEAAARTGPAAAAEPAADRRGEYARALAALDRALQERDVPLVFVVFPLHHSLGDAEPPGLIHWAVATGTELGILTIDLLPALRAAGEPSEALYLLPHDGHPNARGYAIAAAFVADTMARPGPVAARLGLPADAP